MEGMKEREEEGTKGTASEIFFTKIPHPIDVNKKVATSTTESPAHTYLKHQT